MRIQHNIAALNSYRQLSGNNSAVSKNLEKLSSGYKINRAGDDAAGLAISEKMRAQITGLETAQKNANDGISLVQTAEGALTEVHSMLNRMVELATQSANGTYDNDVDRDNLQKELDSLLDEIDRISEATNFNGINLLDGSLGGMKVKNNEGAVAIAGTFTADAGLTASTGLADVTINGLPKDGTYKVKYTTNQVDIIGIDGVTVLATANATGIDDGSTLTFAAVGGSGVTGSAKVNTKTTLVAATDAKVLGTVDGAKEATLGSVTLEMINNPKEGDQITIYDGVAEKTYTFGAGADQIAIGNTVTETVANLKVALEADYTEGGQVTVDGTKITVKTNSAAADPQALPTVEQQAKGLTLQVGDTDDAFQKVSIAVDDMSAKGLGLEDLKDVGIADQRTAGLSIDKIKTAINSVSSTRGDLGAIQNRLEHTINNLGVTTENMTAAESRIRDTDMAEEMMAYTKNNILVQAAQAMLAQANQIPQGVLQLLQ